MRFGSCIMKLGRHLGRTNNMGMHMGNGFMDEEFGNVYKKHVPLLAAMKHFARAYGWGEY